MYGIRKKVLFYSFSVFLSFPLEGFFFQLLLTPKVFILETDPWDFWIIFSYRDSCIAIAYCSVRWVSPVSYWDIHIVCLNLDLDYEARIRVCIAWGQNCGIYPHVVCFDSSFLTSIERRPLSNPDCLSPLHSKLVCFDDSLAYVVAMIKLETVCCRGQASSRHSVSARDDGRLKSSHTDCLFFIL